MRVQQKSLTSTPTERWIQPDQSSAPAELVGHFLLQFESLNTRRNYFSDIDSFFSAWSIRGVDLSKQMQTITEKHILLWLEQFSESSTRARKLASLSSFFKFCEQRRVIENNPCRLLRRPSIVRTQSTQALNEEETVLLLETLKNRATQQPDGAHAKRQWQSAQLAFAVIHTLFSVGMRVDELCELRVGDLLFNPPQFKLRFVIKGGEEHVVAVSQACAEVITEYLKACRGSLKPDDFVFSRVQTANKKVKLSQTAVFAMIRSAAVSAGINKTLSPHSARATVATVLHRRGVPLGFIQSLLNHKQITTTAHYVKKANERSESAALKAPVSQWLGDKD